MPTVTFTLASLPSSSAKRLRFEPRDAPWVNTAGAVVTPDGFESSYPRGAVQSVTLDTGPWRVRIGLSWYPFDVPAAGGDLAELITWSMPAGAPASTIAAAVAEFLTANPNGLLTQAAADANYAPLWQASTTYAVGAQIISPSTGDTLTRLTAGTSRSSFDATERALWAVAYGERPIDIRDYLVSANTFNLPAVIAAMESQGKACFIPAGDWYPNTVNVALNDTLVAANATSFVYRFTGVGKQSRFHLPDGMANGDYLMLVNSASSATYQTPHKLRIHNMSFIGGGSSQGRIANIYQRGFWASDLYFWGFNGGFHTTGYCDQVVVERIQAQHMTNGAQSWVWWGESNGDGVHISQVFAYGCGGVKMQSGLGVTMAHCISGFWEFISCDVTLIDNHLEGDGSTDPTAMVTFRGCSARVLSGVYYCTNLRPAFLIDDGTADAWPGRYLFGDGVQWQNRLDAPSSTVGARQGVALNIANLATRSQVHLQTPQVSLFGQTASTGASTYSKIAPLITAADAGIQALLSSTAGRINAANDVLLRYFNGAWDLQPVGLPKLIDTHRVIAPTATATAITASSYVGDMAAGTYYYRLWGYDAAGRMGGATAEFSVTTTGTLPLASIAMMLGDSPQLVVIERGTTSGTYTQWASFVTVRDQLTVVDQGSTIAGQAWSSTSVPTVPGVGLSASERADGIKLTSVGASQIWGTAPPTTGTWQAGDICWSTSPDNPPGWRCVTAGSPGTWAPLPNGTQITTGVGASITAAKTLAVTDPSMQPCDATSGAFTVTLPSTTTPGLIYVIKKIDSTGNTVTVAATSIDGLASWPLPRNNSVVVVMSTATAGTWRVVASNAPYNLDVQNLIQGWSAYFQGSLKVGAGWTLVPATLTATTTLTTGSAPIELVNAASGAVTVTLPSTTTPGIIFTVKKIDSSANAVTVSAGSGTIDGASTLSLATQYAHVQVMSTSTSGVWLVVG